MVGPPGDPLGGSVPELPSNSTVMSLPMVRIKGEARRKNPEKRKCWSQDKNEVNLSFFYLIHLVMTIKISFCFYITLVNIKYISTRHQVCVGSKLLASRGMPSML